MTDTVLDFSLTIGILVLLMIWVPCLHVTEKLLRRRRSPKAEVGASDKTSVHDPDHAARVA